MADEKEQTGMGHVVTGMSLRSWPDEAEASGEKEGPRLLAEDGRRGLRFSLEEQASAIDLLITALDRLSASLQPVLLPSLEIVEGDLLSTQAKPVASTVRGMVEDRSAQIRQVTYRINLLLEALDL